MNFPPHGTDSLAEDLLGVPKQSDRSSVNRRRRSTTSLSEAMRPSGGKVQR